MVHVIRSTSAAARLQAAREFLSKHHPAAEILIVAATRGAADDLARDMISRVSGASRGRATFGLRRFSLTELAARVAATALAGDRRTPGTQTGAEAIAARVVFDARNAGELAHFEPVAGMPGFPKALARTLHELRLANVGSAELVRDSSLANADLGRLLARFEEQLTQSGVNDRAMLFAVAAAACRNGKVRWAALPIVLLDVPLDSHAEQAFAAALAARSQEMLATVPDGDEFAEQSLAAFATSVESREDPAPGGSDLISLRRFVFSSDQPEARDRTGDVSLFSAPGEGREAVEIVRRMLDEAARGVPFDQMAVFLRAPQQYLGLLEHACARGGVPVYFDRGTRRPDPAGRAFIALISCAVDGLSAKRFDEYLSLGQVPRVGAETGPAGTVVPDDETVRSLFEPLVGEAGEGAGEAAEGAGEAGEHSTVDSRLDSPLDSDDEAVVAGTLRSPWKWEELIVESAVVGGRTRADGRARWRRRLNGLAADYRLRIAELKREEPESPRRARFERDLRNLAHLRQFALPIVEELSVWPEKDIWRAWLDRFAALAVRALRRPGRVLQTLADLRPMGEVGPVTLGEARDVLHDRLVMLDWDPPLRRYGMVFVGTPHQARGRSFRVVFVPGLAERVVPRRPREDPLLLDDRRKAVDPVLVRQQERVAAERLLLKIAIGAATDRLYLSYPRLDVAEARARVPSFYALDVARAITGRVPDHRVLAADAATEGGASLAWPAPRDPARAIDNLEHDLAVLKPLLDSPDRAAVKGHANYLLGLNAALRRSVRSRWLRDRAGWSPSDGLVRATPATRPALQAHRLGRRAYSLSALQRFSVCPYQFLLSTIYRLEPRDEPEPLVRMDPLTRGSLFHKVQAEFYRAMEARSALPIRPDRVREAARTVEQVLEEVAAEYAEMLAPAIDRVWLDEIDELRRDLGIWVQRIARQDPWLPTYFEFSFGLSDEGRDPRSLPDPIVIDGRFILHGSVDLIEHRQDLDVLRVTDHKTGRNRSNPDLVVGGGGMLQPVLYSAAIERGLSKKVAEGRLFYATTAGGFTEHTIGIDDYSKGQGSEVLATIDRAVEEGFLPPAPADRACTWCDFRPICGPREEERTARKDKNRLKDLEALRSMR